MRASGGICESEDGFSADTTAVLGCFCFAVRGCYEHRGKEIKRKRGGYEGVKEEMRRKGMGYEEDCGRDLVGGRIASREFQRFGPPISLFASFSFLRAFGF